MKVDKRDLYYVTSGIVNAEMCVPFITKADAEVMEAYIDANQDIYGLQGSNCMVRTYDDAKDWMRHVNWIDFTNRDGRLPEALRTD